LLFGFIFIGCDSKKDDIDIGFVAGLSGKYSILGNDVRDGFFLAFDEIDYKIGEQKINIIEKDDKQDVNENKKVINELLEKDIKLIVGNSTSSMTLSSLNIIKNYPETFLFSATASSGEFSKKDDQLIRVQVEQSNKMYIDIIKYLIKKNKKNIVMIYDSRNSSYVSGYNNIFQKLFIENGGDK
ncbi:MAG: ABC transporter substrate-binding protein, partial [Campylobacterota bacterium]|nr:ABC transporter substrate-binding protein [Campylobacterota bacterium]